MIGIASQLAWRMVSMDPCVTGWTGPGCLFIATRE
jgi:hypothetical protein